MPPSALVLATDDLSLVATLGFFVPAALVVALVAGAIVRDRRRRSSGDDGDQQG